MRNLNMDHRIDSDKQPQYHPRKRSKQSLQYEPDSDVGFAQEEIGEEDQREKHPSEMRITEVLDQNLERLVKNEIRKTPSGVVDIPALCLRTEFFFGIRVGWPFPVMHKPQRLMAMHIIKGLKNRQHVVLESPTGTL